GFRRGRFADLLLATGEEVAQAGRLTAGIQRGVQVGAHVAEVDVEGIAALDDDTGQLEALGHRGDLEVRAVVGGLDGEVDAALQAGHVGALGGVAEHVLGIGRGPRIPRYRDVVLGGRDSWCRCDKREDSSSPRLVVTRPRTTIFPLGTNRSGAKPPERGSSYSRKKPSTASSENRASATKS